MPTLLVVAGALIEQGRLLVAQRDRPPELAGRWELPGGKVAAGESDAAALRRELLEELGIDVSVGARLGDDVTVGETVTLRAYLVTRVGGMPELERGTAVEIDILGMDELSLELDCRYIGEISPAVGGQE